jgi:hypothetical protein
LGLTTSAWIWVWKFVLIKVGILDVEQNLCDVSWTCVEMILEPLMVIPSQVRPVV